MFSKLLKRNPGSSTHPLLHSSADDIFHSSESVNNNHKSLCPVCLSLQLYQVAKNEILALLPTPSSTTNNNTNTKTNPKPKYIIETDAVKCLDKNH